MVANYVGYVVLCGLSNFLVSHVYKVYIRIFVYNIYKCIIPILYLYINT